MQECPIRTPQTHMFGLDIDIDIDIDIYIPCKPQSFFLTYTTFLLTCITTHVQLLLYRYKLGEMEDEQWCEEGKNCQDCRNRDYQHNLPTFIYNSITDHVLRYEYDKLDEKTEQQGALQI